MNHSSGSDEKECWLVLDEIEAHIDLDGSMIEIETEGEPVIVINGRRLRWDDVDCWEKASPRPVLPPGVATGRAARPARNG